MNPAVRSVFAVIDGLLLFVAVEGVFYAIALLGLGMSFDTPTPAYLTCNFTWAIAAAVLGGFTAGVVARRSPVLHGVAMALPLCALAAFNLHKGLGNRHTPYVILLNLLVPVACVLGAGFAARRVARRRRKGLVR